MENGDFTSCLRHASAASITFFLDVGRLDTGTPQINLRLHEDPSSYLINKSSSLNDSVASMRRYSVELPSPIVRMTILSMIWILHHHFHRHPFGVASLTFPIKTTKPPLAPSSRLFGKKNKGGGGSGGKQRQRQPQNQEKQSVQEARFDAATRQFMFTLVGLTKILPDKSKKILDNINVRIIHSYVERTMCKF
jgi:hypothetical protein